MSNITQDGLVEAVAQRGLIDGVTVERIEHVPFMGADLMAAQDSNGCIWAGVSYICNGIGLTKSQKDTQVLNTQTDEVLKEGCLKFQAGVFDPNNATVALRLDFVPLWLAKISITPAMKQERPEVANILKQYQLKAKDVLAAAFLPKQQNYTALSPQLQFLISLETEQKRQAQQIVTLTDKLDNQMTIDHGQQRTLQTEIGSRVYERAAEVFPAKEYKDHIKQFFAAIYHDIKDRFGVASYRDIKPVEYKSAMEYVRTWIEPAKLRVLIERDN